ncbi:MAG: zinc ribbon domain-containing protein [bacterium]|nr:zinc ribbon domain-containing protein [bacterium]
MFCTKCGSTLNDEVKFCSRCGHPAPVLPLVPAAAEAVPPPPLPLRSRGPLRRFLDSLSGPHH